MTFLGDPATPAATCALTFVAGAITEWICAKWVRAVADRRPSLAAAYSMLWATALLLGLEDALRIHAAAASWVLGYGVGCYLAVRFGATVKAGT